MAALSNTPAMVDSIVANNSPLSSHPEMVLHRLSKFLGPHNAQNSRETDGPSCLEGQSEILGAGWPSSSILSQQQQQQKQQDMQPWLTILAHHAIRAIILPLSI